MCAKNNCDCFLAAVPPSDWRAAALSVSVADAYRHARRARIRLLQSPHFSHELLRRRLEHDTNLPKHIVAKPGVGYGLVVDPT
jgi:hypothetical protein